MKNDYKKRKTNIILPKLNIDFSYVKPPTRPAVESMLENLHNYAM